MFNFIIQENREQMRIFDDLNRRFSAFNGFASKIERAGRAPAFVFGN